VPHHGLGNVLRDKKEYDAAIAHFKEAIRLDPQLAVPHHGLGNVLRDKKEYDAAIAHFKEAIRLDPRDALPHHGLGNVLYDKKEYDAAIAQFKEAIRLDAKYAAPHNGLGNVLRDKKEYDAAIAQYQEAIRLDPRDALPHYGLGAVLHDKKESDAAIAHFKEAIRLDPKLALPHYGLGAVLYDKKEYDAAIAEFKQAIRLDPRDAPPHNNLGNVLYDKKEYDAAIAEYEQAIRLDPKLVAPHNGLGNVLYDKKEYDAAIAQFKQAIRLDPKYAQPHDGLGRVLADKKAYDAAIAEYQEAIRLDRTMGAAYANLGLVYRQLGRFSESVSAWGEAAKLMPKHGRIQDELRLSTQLLALDQQLAAIRQGSAKPKAPADAVGLAYFAVQEFKKEYGLAVRLFAEAFAADAKLMAANRYSAACAACLAAAGKGKDAAKLDDKVRADLRHKALAWLRDDVQAGTQSWADNPRSAALLSEMLQNWQSEAPLGSVRDPKELAKLPEGEQQSWRQLWSEVDQLLKKVNAACTETNLKGTLTAKDREQVHEVKMRAGNAYVIGMTSKDFDRYLRLETPQKQVLAAIAPDNLNLRIIFTPEEDAVYCIIATSFEQRGLGAYTLTIRKFPRRKE
jgi:tetratricopeptide (TPR) repeat protein